MSEDEPAQALRQLRADYPHMTITTGFCGPTRVWVARGEHGQRPWLVLSSDLSRFQAALGQPPTA